MVRFATQSWCRIFRSGVETSARWRSGFLLPRRSGRLRTWLWERARSVLSEYSAHAGHGVCAVRSCAKTEALGRWWVRGHALVPWTKRVRGGALVPRCAGSDMLGHGCGNGHGMLRPDFPRTQVTGFLECAVAQKRSQSDTMTARPHTSSVAKTSARRRTAPPLRRFGHVRA